MQAREEDFAEFKYESKKSEVSAIQEWYPTKICNNKTNKSKCDYSTTYL